MEETNTIIELERIIKENRIGQNFEVNGRTFMIDGCDTVREVETKEYLLNEPFYLTDLLSFCQVIKEEIKKIDTTLFVQVISPTEVRAYTTLDNKKRRFCPYICKCNARNLRLNSFDDYETFVINLRANFVETEDTSNVVKMIANIVNCDNQELHDNGVTQTFRTQKGTQLGTQETKSIIRLAPFRTFPEISQPVSEFLFRIKHNGTLYGLFEADGGRWELEAKLNIAEFIKHELTEIDDKVKVLL